MMTAIDVAERKGRWRAFAFYLFATMIVFLLWMSFRLPDSDFFHGMWAGLTAAAAVNLIPLARWLKPNSAVARLLDDETTQQHRQASSMAGFWVAVVAAIAMTLVTDGGVLLSAVAVARIIASAAVAAALVTFATLELRAGRD